jgi:serine/threonine protein kinase
MKQREQSTLVIELYCPEEKEIDGQVAFFAYFLFESPKELWNSYRIPGSEIITCSVEYQHKTMGNVSDYISATMKGIVFAETPDISLVGVARLDSTNATVGKRLASGTCGVAWLGSIPLEESHNGKVVFKQLTRSDIVFQSEFLREVLMMAQLRSRYLVQLLGICSVSSSLVESSANVVEKNCAINGDGLLMVIEFAPLGDLTQCREVIQESSLLLKVKIALDIARGLLSLQTDCRLPMMHRDVRSQNVFVFSLDELNARCLNSVHAKLGDFGTLVVASPTCGEALGNWQYLAPEVFRGSLLVPYSKEIDVYSFGTLLWEILSGSPPFLEFLAKQEIEEAKQQIIAGLRPPINPQWHPVLRAMLVKCWQADAMVRPALSEIVSELEAMWFSLSL